MRQCSVIITDDHPLMAHATKSLLEQMDGVNVVCVSNTGAECISKVEEHLPTMVILDVLLPDISGVDVAKKIKETWPCTYVVVFSGVDLNPLIPKLLDNQVDGFISKGSKQDTIKSIISCILDGQIVFPESYIRELTHPPIPEHDIDLTDDEVEIMHMIVNGCTLEQIAANICMSKRSVDNYQRRMYNKMGVKKRYQAIELFVRSKHYNQNRLTED